MERNALIMMLLARHAGYLGLLLVPRAALAGEARGTSFAALAGRLKVSRTHVRALFDHNRKMNQILIPPGENGQMVEAATSQATAPCPKCRKDMVLAVIIPHPVAQQLARHAYLCRGCNQTRTYVLPVGLSAEAEGTRQNASTGLAAPAGEPDGRRSEPRATLNAPATIYDKEGNFLAPCTVRDLSRSGGRLELFKESTLPQYLRLSLLPDGGGRRLCSKVWQLGPVAGVRFVEKPTA